MDPLVAEIEQTPNRDEPLAEGTPLLIDELWVLRHAMVAQEHEWLPQMSGINERYRAGARNLAHYLALRQSDCRPLQERLANMGLSSLGRTESHVLANVDRVLGILHRLSGHPWHHRPQELPVDMGAGYTQLQQHADDLFGPAPKKRPVRIMVTLASECAEDVELIRKYARAGMNVARINCAHDGPAQWRAMAKHIRRVAKEEGKHIAVLMDLGGPKLRTGPVAPGAAVLKLRPNRDEFGRLVTPIHLGLRAIGSTQPITGVCTYLEVDAKWLLQLKNGDHLDLRDARGAERTLLVMAVEDHGVRVECDQTIYVIPETRLRCCRALRGPQSTAVAGVPQKVGALHLRRGDRLRLTRDGLGMAAPKHLGKGHHHPARIACTLPEVFPQVRAGEPIWFDDGKIGGVVVHASPDWLDIEITRVREQGDKLEGDKGINLPESHLTLPALTEKDFQDLDEAVQLADIVGLSFVQRADDIDLLRKALAERHATDMGVVIKIETRAGFENLPNIMFAAMACHAAGIMIARGDLAVECGYERLAEIQEEILWATEAAHMPVVWATQVLESQAKTGFPSRAEITDAAMGERAECVMLNKGAHLVDAIRSLDNILCRMQDHQEKKRSLLRPLQAWHKPLVQPTPRPPHAPKKD